MAKDITTKYFNKNVYNLKKVDESGELKLPQLSKIIS